MGVSLGAVSAALAHQVSRDGVMMEGISDVSVGSVRATTSRQLVRVQHKPGEPDAPHLAGQHEATSTEQRPES